MKTKESRKSFVDIHEDYAFFLAHSNEPEACRSSMLGVLAGLDWKAPVHLLDFGCGGGEFLEQLLRQWNIPRKDLRLALIDVDPVYLETAGKKMAMLASEPIQTGSSLEYLDGAFDLITSNHALYYVPDLENTLKQMLKRLTKTGTGILILGVNRTSCAVFGKWPLPARRKGFPISWQKMLKANCGSFRFPFKRNASIRPCVFRTVRKTV